MHVVPAEERKMSSLAEVLEMARELMKQERWEDARKQLRIINQSHKARSLDRAEVNFSYGRCLEELGKSEDAMKVYNSVIAVYGSHVTWSSQALERGFNLAYKTKDPEKKIKAYSYLRKVLYMFQNMQEADDPSGALSRIRKRLPLVVKELKLTPEQLRQLDRKLGIIEK